MKLGPGLSPCLLYSVIFLTVLCVVCYQSFTRNSNNSSGYAYNSEFITQPTPICHSPSKFKFWIWQLDFCLKLMFLVVLVNIILVSIISVTFNLDACKISFINYLKVLFNFEKKRSLMWSMFKIVQKLVQAPPTCLYSPVASLNYSFILEY